MPIPKKEATKIAGVLRRQSSVVESQRVTESRLADAVAEQSKLLSLTAESVAQLEEALGQLLPPIDLPESMLLEGSNYSESQMTSHVRANNAHIQKILSALSVLTARAAVA